MMTIGRTVRELSYGLIQVLESPEDIRQTCRRPEILLLETELFTDYKEGLIHQR